MTIQMSEQVNELAAALAKVQGQLRPAAENARNPFLKNSYADLASVWDACRDLLAENGLSVVQLPTSNTASEIGLTTIIMHESGQYVTDSITMPLMDEKGKSAAQVAGSIVSYFRRYALSAALGITTGDDDDGNLGSDPRNRQPRQRRPANGDARGATAPQAQSARPRPGQGDIEPPKPTEAQVKRFHVLGKEVYGDDWDHKREELVVWITGKRADGKEVKSSKQLHRAEMQQLIQGMEEKAKAAPA